MIVRPAPPEHYEWIAKRANVDAGASFRAIEAVGDSGRIVAMVGYDGWTENACLCHVALEHPAALRHILKPAFLLPFVQLGRGVLVCTVLSTNARSLALVKRLGFRETHRGRDWWAPGVDLVWHEMRREDCRFIDHEQRRAA